MVGTLVVVTKENSGLGEKFLNLATTTAKRATVKLYSA